MNGDAGIKTTSNQLEIGKKFKVSDASVNVYTDFYIKETKTEDKKEEDLAKYISCTSDSLDINVPTNILNNLNIKNNSNSIFEVNRNDSAIKVYLKNKESNEETNSSNFSVNVGETNIFKLEDGKASIGCDTNITGKTTVSKRSRNIWGCKYQNSR